MNNKEKYEVESYPYCWECNQEIPIFIAFDDVSQAEEYIFCSKACLEKWQER